MRDAPSETPKPAGYIQVARMEQAVLLRIMGLGGMNIAPTMNDFVTSCLESNYRHFALDLASCVGMDSTFMGTIVGIARNIKEAGGWVCMLNVSEDNQRLLDLIGVWQFVPVKDTFPIEDVETECLLPDIDTKRRLLHIREAHENLVAIDERNRDRFGRFLSALEQEMTETKANPDAGPRIHE